MKYVVYFIKVMIAGILSFGILNLLCLVYHNKPVSINVENGATSTKYVGNTAFSIMREGWGRGHVNDDGYNNETDIRDVNRIDVLLMGSSQLEGFQVDQKQTITAVMNRLSGEDWFTYNVGISGHNFWYCVHDLENALMIYRPKRFAVLELSSIEIGSVSMEQISELPVSVAQSSGLVGFLKSIPYIRLLAVKYDDLRHKGLEADPGISESGISESGIAESVVDTANTREILSYIADICAKYEVRPLIFLHQRINVDEKGRGYTENSEQQISWFRAMCEQQGIEFVDTSGVLLELYETEHRMPNGFVNTVFGTGHLNKYGHEIIANELYERLSLLMEE